jgi:lipopolysaccharide biosynthesis glycosyltransferase
MSITDTDMPIKDVKLIHYNMYNKPWLYSDVPYEKFFWQYAKSTPFWDYLQSLKQNYPEEKKIIDKTSGEILIKNAIRIADSDKTFIKVLGSMYEQ